MTSTEAPCIENFRIRRMRESDVPGIMAIESVSFGKHHWSADSFKNEMNNNYGRYFVLVDAEDESRLYGYCGYWAILDEVHITTVAVSPELRGRSLGEVLVIHMLERCLGSTVHWVTLEVRRSNYSAQNLYYKYGFKSEGVRPKYYQDNREDGIIMTTPDILSESFRETFRDNKAALKERLGAWPIGLGENGA